MQLVFVITAFFIWNQSFSQDYLTNKNKYHFAQGAMGLDFQYVPPTGKTNSLSNGINKTYNFGNYTVAKIVIGGLHFYGHADIALSIPISSFGIKQDSIAISNNDFDIFSFKYFPIAIQKNKLRPYIGTSMNVNLFSQQGTDSFKKVFGSTDFKFSLPISAGICLQKKNWLLLTNMTYLINPKRDVYINRTDRTRMQIPAYTFSISVRKIFEQTAPEFEQRFKSGTMKKEYEKNKRHLNAFSFGVGLSASIQSAGFSGGNRDFMSQNPISAFPEFGLGYYLNKPDIHFNVAYRNVSSSIQGFGLKQTYKRQSVTLEAYKFLCDYKGFLPFVGVGISNENLKFSESDFGNKTLEIFKNKVAPNITFGWDIRYHKLYWLMLRTNFRYYPQLHLSSLQGKINFNPLEMNFIQAVIYPQRFKYFKTKKNRKV